MVSRGERFQAERKTGALAVADTDLDMQPKSGIMTPDEVAAFLKKSLSWVYQHWKELGGAKLGGSLFFPSKEDLYERLFGNRQGVEVRLHPQGGQAHGSLVQDQKRSVAGRGAKTGGGTQPASGGGSDDRHGLLRAG